MVAVAQYRMSNHPLSHTFFSLRYFLEIASSPLKNSPNYENQKNSQAEFKFVVKMLVNLGLH